MSGFRCEQASLWERGCDIVLLLLTVNNLNAPDTNGYTNLHERRDVHGNPNDSFGYGSDPEGAPANRVEITIHFMSDLNIVDNEGHEGGTETSYAMARGYHRVPPPHRALQYQVLVYIVAECLPVRRLLSW